ALRRKRARLRSRPRAAKPGLVASAASVPWPAPVGSGDEGWEVVADDCSTADPCYLERSSAARHACATRSAMLRAEKRIALARAPRTRRGGAEPTPSGETADLAGAVGAARS